MKFEGTFILAAPYEMKYVLAPFMQGMCNVKAATGYMVKVFVCEFKKKATLS